MTSWVPPSMSSGGLSPFHVLSHEVGVEARCGKFVRLARPAGDACEWLADERTKLKVSFVWPGLAGRDSSILGKAAAVVAAIINRCARAGQRGAPRAGGERRACRHLGHQCANPLSRGPHGRIHRMHVDLFRAMSGSEGRWGASSGACGCRKSSGERRSVRGGADPSALPRRTPALCLRSCRCWCFLGPPMRTPRPLPAGKSRVRALGSGRARCNNDWT